MTDKIFAAAGCIIGSLGMLLSFLHAVFQWWSQGKVGFFLIWIVFALIAWMMLRNMLRTLSRNRRHTS